MKYFNSLILPTFTLAVLLSCTKTSEKTTADSTAVQQLDSTQAAKVLSAGPMDVALIEKVILTTPSGVERFSLIGKNIAALKQAEKTAVTDTTSSSITFTSQFQGADDQFVDAIYNLENNAASGVELDIFLNDATDIAKLKQSLESTFTKKHGKATVNSDASDWLVNNKILRLRDISFKNAAGLKVSFFEKGSNQIQ
jgi:hypothetical protein